MGLGWVQVKLKFFHILTSAICAGTIALCSSMVSKKDVRGHPEGTATGGSEIPLIGGAGG